MEKRKRIVGFSLLFMFFFAVVYSINGQVQSSNNTVNVGTIATLTSITNPVAVTNAGLTNIDVLLSTRTKPSDSQHATIDGGSIGNTAFGVSGGVANIGIVRAVPSSCPQSTNFSNATAQVATGAGTSVNSTTTCITYAYANNITNAAVTLRLQDKTGTPVIWLGGNADFTIPANSNIRIPIDGVTFTSGITAIAGTASAINLQINGLQ